MSKNSNRKPSKHILVIISLLLFSLTLITYLPSLRNDFVWDDEKYILENTPIHSLNLQTIRWMFTTSYSSNWHPLTWLSHALDYKLWGLKSRGHHLINIIFHGLNTSLVFLLMVSILSSLKPPSIKPAQILIAGGITSLLFALHPMHVESVAWVAERKDLLSAFFFLLSLISYLSYASGTPHKRKIRFTLRLFFFVLALMSKPMAVSLPLILLLLDYYPLERFKLSYWVAWTLLQKIRRAMAEQDRRYGLKGIVELDDAYFGGTEEIAKRGRGTTQSKILVAVSTDIEKKHAGFVKMKVTQKLDKHTVNKFVEENIEPGSKIQTDDLAIYNSLTDLGVKHEQYPIVSGEKPLPWVHTIISNAKTFCLGTYHRFGRKHLQAYLDEFCYRFNRRFWEDQLFDRLLAACINCEHITYAELTQ